MNGRSMGLRNGSDGFSYCCFYGCIVLYIQACNYWGVGVVCTWEKWRDNPIETTITFIIFAGRSLGE